MQVRDLQVKHILRSELAATAYIFGVNQRKLNSALCKCLALMCLRYAPPSGHGELCCHNAGVTVPSVWSHNTSVLFLFHSSANKF